MPRIEAMRAKPLESFHPTTLNPQILGAWIRGLRLGGKEHLTVDEIVDGLVALCEAVQQPRQDATPRYPISEDDFR